MSGSCRRTPAAPAISPESALENGDRLTRSEFERRYEARPDIKNTVLREQQRALGEAAHKAFAARLAGGSPPGETAD